MSLLNMALFCIHVGLGTSHFVTFSSMGLGNLFWPLIFSFPRHHDLRSFDVKYCQIQCRATDMFKRSFQSSSNLRLVLVHFHHVPLSRVNDVGNIMALLWPGHFLSTAAHYPGIWSRDSLLVPWSLHASMAGFSHSMQGSHHWTSIEWFYGCSMSNHYSNFLHCTFCTLRAIVIIGGFSRIC